jgi:hypothetical protein
MSDPQDLARKVLGALEPTGAASYGQIDLLQYSRMLANVVLEGSADQKAVLPGTSSALNRTVLEWEEEWATIDGSQVAEFRSTDEGWYIWADGDYGWKLSRGQEAGEELGHTMSDPLKLQTRAQRLQDVLDEEDG